MDTPADRLHALAQEIRAIPDAADQAREATEALKALQDIGRELRATRQDAVLKLRAKPLTLREVGELLGMSTGRVDQIAKGK